MNELDAVSSLVFVSLDCKIVGLLLLIFKRFRKWCFLISVRMYFSFIHWLFISAVLTILLQVDVGVCVPQQPEQVLALRNCCCKFFALLWWFCLSPPPPHLHLPTFWATINSSMCSDHRIKDSAVFASQPLILRVRRQRVRHDVNTFWNHKSDLQWLFFPHDTVAPR